MRSASQAVWADPSQLSPGATLKREVNAMTRDDHRLRSMLEAERTELMETISHYEVLVSP